MQSLLTGYVRRFNKIHVGEGICLKGATRRLCAIGIAIYWSWSDTFISIHLNPVRASLVKRPGKCVSWVSPQQLRDAATQLREAVRTGSSEMRIILKIYERNANRIDPLAQEFVCDLNDIITMTNWAEEEGATKMTLEVNW